MSVSERYINMRFTLCPTCKAVETPGTGPCADCLADIHREGSL
jgi:hypothetical protein